VASPNSTETPNISSDTNRRVSPDAVDAVVDRYDALMHRLIQGHAPEFAEIGITMAQAKVLYVVMAAGELRMSELAARLGVGSSSASGLADRLVELGLLRRHDEPGDRRQVVVTTTPEAVALLERFRELNLRQLRELLAQLRHDELDIVNRSLEILASAIDRTIANAQNRENHS
jgi:DNA-binding MarR family transcriptional regulator